MGVFKSASSAATESPYHTHTPYQRAMALYGALTGTDPDHRARCLCAACKRVMPLYKCVVDTSTMRIQSDVLGVNVKLFDFVFCPQCYERLKQNSDPSQEDTSCK